MQRRVHFVVLAFAAAVASVVAGDQRAPSGASEDALVGMEHSPPGPVARVARLGDGRTRGGSGHALSVAVAVTPAAVLGPPDWRSAAAARPRPSHTGRGAAQGIGARGPPRG